MTLLVVSVPLPANLLTLPGPLPASPQEPPAPLVRPQAASRPLLGNIVFESVRRVLTGEQEACFVKALGTGDEVFRSSLARRVFMLRRATPR